MPHKHPRKTLRVADIEYRKVCGNRRAKYRVVADSAPRRNKTRSNYPCRNRFCRGKEVRTVAVQAYTHSHRVKAIFFALQCRIGVCHMLCHGVPDRLLQVIGAGQKLGKLFVAVGFVCSPKVAEHTSHVKIFVSCDSSDCRRQLLCRKSET